MTYQNEKCPSCGKNVQVYIDHNPTYCQHCLSLLNSAERQTAELSTYELKSHFDRAIFVYRQGAFEQVYDDINTILKHDPLNIKAINLKAFTQLDNFLRYFNFERQPFISCWEDLIYVLNNDGKRILSQEMDERLIDFGGRIIRLQHMKENYFILVICEVLKLFHRFNTEYGMSIDIDAFKFIIVTNIMPYIEIRIKNYDLTEYDSDCDRLEIYLTPALDIINNLRMLLDLTDKPSLRVSILNAMILAYTKIVDVNCSPLFETDKLLKKGKIRPDDGDAFYYLSAINNIKVLTEQIHLIDPHYKEPEPDYINKRAVQSLNKSMKTIIIIILIVVSIIMCCTISRSYLVNLFTQL